MAWTKPRLTGFGRFGLLWSGQAVTLVGNSVLRFAFVVQAWTSGQQATRVTLLAVCGVLPQIVLSPTAGALVDRLHKRTALQIADIGGGLVVGVLAALYFSGRLSLWEIYATVLLISCAAAFQYPALSSTVPILVPEHRLQRANGLLTTAQSAATICGPALAAVLVTVFGLGSVLVVDLVTFAWSVASVWLIRLPQRPRTEPGSRTGAWRRLRAESAEGLRFIFTRRGLRGLAVVFFTINLVMVLGFAVIQPMVLARTGGDAGALAAVMTSIGVGGVAGGLLMGAWGGPRAQVRGMMLGVVGMCISSLIFMAVVRSVAAWCAAVFVATVLMQIVNSTLQTVVQRSVPGELQGRVFGAVQFVTRLSTPMAMALSGPLADGVFDRQAASGTGLVGWLRPLLGSGPGTGMAAMLLLAGILGTAVALWGLASRSVRAADLPAPVPESVPELARAAEA